MRVRRLLSEGTWVVAGQVAAMLGALVGVRVLTSLLAPAEYGELALGLTMATLAHQLIIGPIGNAVLRFYAPAAEQAAVGSYLEAVRDLVIRGSVLLVGTATVIVLGFLSFGYARLATIAALSFVFSILSGSGTLISSVQSAARQRGIVALHQALDPWARFVFAMALIVGLTASSTFALGGYCLGALLILCSQLVFIRRITHAASPYTPSITWRESLRNYAMPFAVWGVFSWGQLVSDRWALEYFSTRSEVGVYAALFQVGYVPISLGTGMAIQLIQPILFSRAGDASDAARNTDVARLTRNLTIFALVLTLILFVGALVVHSHVFHLFVAPEYRVASPLLPWIVLAAGVFAAGQTLTLNLMGRLRPKAMMTAKISTSVLGVGFNVLGASLAGTAGVVVANCAFSTAFFVWMAYLFKRTA